jgi:alpha-galactosidase
MTLARTSQDCKLLLAVFLAGGVVALAVGRSTAKERAPSRKAMAGVLSGFLDKGSMPPISFTYGGRPSRDLLPTWKITRSSKDESDRTLHTVNYTDTTSGLTLVVEVCEYKDFPAVEWVQHFKNAGAIDTPIIENIQALDVTLDIGSWQGQVVLHKIMGSTFGACDFAPMDEVLPPGAKSMVAPIGGRSSNGAMPFFNVEFPESRGVVVAIGWTGQWEADFERNDYRWFDTVGKLTVRTGMTHTHLKLLPGEQIRTPQSLLLFWDGDQNAGHNQFRRFLLSHKIPRIEGKPANNPIAATGWFLPQFASDNTGNGVTEENQIAYAKTFKKMGLDIEYFWLDAGWFEGGWALGVGNWFPNKKAFPNGLGNLSKAVHELGMKFLVWFEPERVLEGTWLHREHPDWLLACPEAAKRGSAYGDPRAHLLNLGNPAARAWLTDHVSRMIEEANIGIYRHDCNIDPLDFWRRADAPDRQGITEIRHVDGLYSYWEDLKSRHPGLLVDCVSAGNRRYDLETVSRAINLTQSDYCFHPTAAQCQTYGISFFIQLHTTPCSAVDKYGFRSFLSPGTCLSWDLSDPNFPAEQAREDIALAKRVRPYFFGDYYPLTPYSIKENIWLAYQFHRSDLDEGVVFAFRRPSCLSSKLTLSLGGVRQDAEYQVENVDTGAKEQHRGLELASGLQLMSEQKPGSVVLIYRRLK